MLPSKGLMYVVRVGWGLGYSVMVLHILGEADYLSDRRGERTRKQSGSQSAPHSPGKRSNKGPHTSDLCTD